MCLPDSPAWCLQLQAFLFNYRAPTEIYTLSLHDALPISRRRDERLRDAGIGDADHAGFAVQHPRLGGKPRSEEHTSELQSRVDLVCRLLLEKKKPPIRDEHRHRKTASADATDCSLRLREL